MSLLHAKVQARPSVLRQVQAAVWLVLQPAPEQENLMSSRHDLVEGSQMSKGTCLCSFVNNCYDLATSVVDFAAAVNQLQACKGVRHRFLTCMLFTVQAKGYTEGAADSLVGGIKKNVRPSYK